MSVIIPSPIAEIDASQKRNALINDDNLLMMCPKKYPNLSMIWMSHNFYVFVFVFQCLLTVVAVDTQRHLDFLVQHHKHLDSLRLK